jgi:hypothetical protein
MKFAKVVVGKEVERRPINQFCWIAVWHTAPNVFWTVDVFDCEDDEHPGHFQYRVLEVHPVRDSAISFATRHAEYINAAMARAERDAAGVEHPECNHPRTHTWSQPGEGRVHSWFFTGCPVCGAILKEQKVWN